MSEQKITTKYSIKEIFLFLLVVFCFVCVPAFIISYSTYIYFQINEEKIISNLKSYTQHITNELRYNLYADKYFCRLFHEYNLREFDSNIENTINYCKKLKGKYGANIDFVVLTNDGEIKYNTNPTIYNYPSKTWHDAYHHVKYYHSPIIKLYLTGKRGNSNALKEIFGPNTLAKTFGALYKENIYSLVWGDYSGKHSPGGIYTFKWGGFFVFISKELLNDIVHFKNTIQTNSTDKDIITGLFNPKNSNNSIWTNINLNNKQELVKVLYDSESQVKSFIETTDHYICKQSLTDNYRIFSFSQKKNTKLILLGKCFLVFLIYCFFSSHIIKYFINTILLKKPGEASIRLKIAFLFIFATAIPLFLFALVSYEYETHKRETLINEAKMWSNENIMNIDQRYQSYLKTISNNFDNYIAEWGKGLKEKKLTNEYSNILGEKFSKYNNHSYFIVSSSTPYIGTKEGLFKYHGNLDNLEIDFSDSVCNKIENVKPEDMEDFVCKYKLEDYITIIIVIKKVFSDLYGHKIPDTVLSKLEIISESILQRPLPELTYIFIDIENNGLIKEWGYSNRVYMIYFKLLHIHEKSSADYCVIVAWIPKFIQQKFIEEISVKVNRNSQSFKFLAYQKTDRVFIPNQYKENSLLEAFAKRAGDKPTEELEIINLEGEDYIAVSVLGKNLDKYCFVGLYPMKNIEIKIKNQNTLLLLLGFLSLILSIGLAQLLSKSFINPLLILQEGALAIKNRNFKYRLTGLATDEFGEVGNVFNHVMVGLEDLELAGIVQESMFPPPIFSQGKFSIYGKSVTMIDVGGDYLDFFKVDDKSFAVLLGDVAGHGVGAAVIMAMAKASILNSGEYLHSPAAVLNQLHKIILASRNSKQRKIMTFQYLYVNSETGENLYSNAGACSPWLIRHSDNSVQEMKMPGPVLGAFKKTIYKEMPLDIKPGDAIVFYTDGIVECKDKNGEMLGYDRLKTLLLNCWNENPEKYYNNIYNAYLDYVGKDAEAGDDLTFIVLMFNEKI